MKRLPNILTVSRLLLTVGFVYYLTREGVLALLLATLIFSAATFTDFLDGYYAKKHNLISNFGKIMDPLADKILMLAAFFVFMKTHVIAAWMFYLILLREIVVTGCRFWAIKEGYFLAAERAGKLKTVLQILTVFFVLFFKIGEESGFLRGRSGWECWCLTGIYTLMLLTVGITLYSGVTYLWNNRKIFLKTRKGHPDD